MVHYTKETQPQVKKYIYDCILQHPQVVVSPIANNCIKLYIDVQVEPQLVPKFLLQLPIIELHNSMVGPPEEGGITDAIYAENNIIVSY